MSESVTTSAPAAPPAAAPSTPAPAAPPPPQSDSGPVLGGPPNAQQPLSVSEAARLLNRHRREAAQPAPAPGAPQGAAPAAPAQGEPGAPAKPSAADAMARALGVPDAGLAPGAPAESTPDAGVEFEGRRYSRDELRNQLSMAADYTKKTQQLADHGRQVQAQAEALAQVLPLIQPEIQRLQQALQGIPQPDPALIEQNPQEYLRQQSRYEQSLAEQRRLAQLGSMQSEAHARAMQQQVEQSNQQLAQEFPQWGDPATRSAWQQDIVNWALEKGGYTRDELRGLTDARHLKLMMKAMQLDRLIGGVQTRAPATITGQVVRGVPPPPAPAQQVQRAEQAFEARPSVRNGAALLAARRSGGNGLAR